MSSGIIKTDTILDKIIAYKGVQVGQAKASVPQKVLELAVSSALPPRNFLAPFGGSYVGLIAEVKHASPSKGVLIDPFEPVALAQQYVKHGASCISVLTDEQFFKGHLDYLKDIRLAVDVPLLRKEFIIDPYQVYEGRAAGADAILLIVAALEDALLKDLFDVVMDLNMTPLVEVHNEREMERALMLAAPLIGVNNRDLHDFSVDLQTTQRLAGMVPEGTFLIGESGIRTADDVRALGGVHGILVGETIVKADDRVAILRELSSVERG